MGSGKSSVGAQVAARLGRPFVDLDREVERLSGRSVRALFREQGEAAFRRLEAEVCRRHAAPGGSVIATGGGTLEAPGNLAALAAGGRLVW
ncbi:MAG: shikimate kinase, partial [Planctomycetes bacterium]|nr:shikimate kinase [Planctomycetota bacterium]